MFILLFKEIGGALKMKTKYKKISIQLKAQSESTNMKSLKTKLYTNLQKPNKKKNVILPAVNYCYINGKYI